MAWYRKIDTRISNDQKFRKLSDDGKLMFYTLLSHPHLTALGAMRATTAGLAAEMGWKHQRCLNSIQELSALNMVDMDEAGYFLALTNFLKYNEPEGPNSVKKAWPHSLQLIPECAGKSRLLARCRKYLASKTPDFKVAMGDGIWHAMGDAIEDGKRDPSTDSSLQPSSIQERGARNKEQEPPPKPPQGGVGLNDEQFENVWNKYPDRDGKKLGKAEAEKKWRKLSEADRAQVLTAVQHYAQHAARNRSKPKDLQRWLQEGKDAHGRPIEPWREWLARDSEDPDQSE